MGVLGRLVSWAYNEKRYAGSSNRNDRATPNMSDSPGPVYSVSQTAVPRTVDHTMEPVQADPDPVALAISI